jgi:antitoxin component of RelBE/YafQ-DinJ toxin-antitoxin module
LRDIESRAKVAALHQTSAELQLMEIRLVTISLRIDDALHERLCHRARGAGISVSELVRPALKQVADPARGYIYTSNDEILATTLQVLAILAAEVRRRSPEALAEGMADARAILQRKGLLAAKAGP